MFHKKPIKKAIVGQHKKVRHSPRRPVKTVLKPLVPTPEKEILVFDPQAKLSQYFSHKEMASSDTATRGGIINVPDSEPLLAARALAINVLDPTRIHFNRGFSPQSWFRCEELEKVVAHKGYLSWCKRKNLLPKKANWRLYFARKSHPKGEAADIEIPGVANDELFEWIRDNLAFDQLIRERPKPGQPMSGWVHVSFRRSDNRNQAFTL